MAAFLLSHSGLFQRLTGRQAGWRGRVLLALFGGALAIGGTYWGIPIQSALANTRVIGAMTAGLLGGPAVGLAAGLIGGLHRYTLGGFTALACGLSTTMEACWPA